MKGLSLTVLSILYTPVIGAMAQTQLRLTTLEGLRQQKRFVPATFRSLLTVLVFRWEMGRRHKAAKSIRRCVRIATGIGAKALQNTLLLSEAGVR